MPHDKKQIYNQARNVENRPNSTTGKAQKSNFIDLASMTNTFIQKIEYGQEGKPRCLLGSKQMFYDMHKYCCIGTCTFAIDVTFRVGNLYLTITCYSGLGH